MEMRKAERKGSQTQKWCDYTREPGSDLSCWTTTTAKLLVNTKADLEHRADFPLMEVGSAAMARREDTAFAGKKEHVVIIETVVYKSS